jgi:putative FmdB family regulatory protein
VPTYEYKCEKCETEFEAVQPISADPLEKCPSESCDGKVQRLISGGTGFTLKGSGWFKDGY